MQQEQVSQEWVSIEDLLAKGERVQVQPQGFSMYPFVFPGRDWVILESVEEYRRGDTVLYRRDGSILVLHRIWKKKEDGFYMVGDNQIEIEGPIRADQIKGKMVMLIRKGKPISIKNPLYVALSGFWLLIRPCRRIIALSVAKIKKAARRIFKK